MNMISWNISHTTKYLLHFFPLASWILKRTGLFLVISSKNEPGYLASWFSYLSDEGTELKNEVISSSRFLRAVVPKQFLAFVNGTLTVILSPSHGVYWKIPGDYSWVKYSAVYWNSIRSNEAGYMNGGKDTANPKVDNKIREGWKSSEVNRGGFRCSKEKLHLETKVCGCQH